MPSYPETPLDREVDRAIARANREALDAPLDALDLRMIERVWHTVELPHDPEDCSICRGEYEYPRGEE